MFGATARPQRIREQRARSFYNAKTRADDAKRIHPRTIFAIGRYEPDVYRAWVGTPGRDDDGTTQPVPMIVVGDRPCQGASWSGSWTVETMRTTDDNISGTASPGPVVACGGA